MKLIRTVDNADKRYRFNRKGYYKPAMCGFAHALIFGMWLSAGMRYHGQGRYWTWVS